MSQIWERLFVAAARFFGFAVAAVPVAVIVILIVAFIVGQHSSGGVEIVRTLFSQLLVTLLIAVVATVFGTTLGMGCAIFSHELAHASVARVIRLHAKFLAALPAVTLGWLGVAVLLPPVHAAQPSWVLAVAASVIALAILPQAYILTVRAIRALPAELLQAAAALGANATQATSQVILPGSQYRLAGIYAAVLARALPESAAVSIVFLCAVGSGYPVTGLSLGAVLLAQGTALRVIDAGMPLAALALLGLSLAARVAAARRVGELEWV